MKKEILSRHTRGGENRHVRYFGEKNRRRRGIPEMLLDGKYPRLEREDFTLSVTQYEVTPGCLTIEQDRRRVVYTDCFESISRVCNNIEQVIQKNTQYCKKY